MNCRDELTDDALTGDFRVYQRRRGHRYSLDDTVTAWVAARARPGARRVLDLGCGLGSVLLMLAYKLPRAQLWGLEAQAESFELARRNVARNRVDGRVRLFRGDLRDDSPLSQILDEAREAGEPAFELVTGTPPYQPPGQGTVSPDPQRAHARVELRGGVEDYLQAAARAVAPGGLVVVCADARTPERVQEGACEAGLRLLTRQDVVPAAEYRRPLFGVFTLTRLVGDGDDGRQGRAPRHLPDLIARNADGSRGEDVRALRRFFDLPIRDDEAPSPRRGEGGA
ncbi:MAG: methyltransferase [Myxococcales bacterium]|jgi:tRNA1(Val) A37 N6-methylase TrmN6